MLLRTLFAITLFIMSAISVAENKTLYFGMSGPLSGDLKYIGKNMRDGIEAYFNKVNKQGGINGFKLKLIVRDDVYEPFLAKQNMMHFIRSPQIIATIGNVGTPTAGVTYPLANAYKMLFYAPSTGASFLRKTPPERYIINFRASYQQEMNAIISHILNQGIKWQEIGYFVQSDSFGRMGYRLALNALRNNQQKIDTKKIVTSYYPRNTTLVDPAIQKVMSLDPEHKLKAFVLIGATKPVAKFIRDMKLQYTDVKFYTFSFNSPAEVKRELCQRSQVLCKEFIKNVFMTQVVPPVNTNTPTINEYKNTLKSYNSKLIPNAVSLEGYLSAKVLTLGLKNLTVHPTRESIIDGLQNLKKIDLDFGETMFINKQQHQVSYKVWLIKLEDGKEIVE